MGGSRPRGSVSGAQKSYGSRTITRTFGARPPNVQADMQAATASCVVCPILVQREASALPSVAHSRAEPPVFCVLRNSK